MIKFIYTLVPRSDTIANQTVPLQFIFKLLNNFAEDTNFVGGQNYELEPAAICPNYRHSSAKLQLNCVLGYTSYERNKASE